MSTKKIIQALTYIAYSQPDHKIDNMKAYKLLWLADRYQLRRCGRLISGDTYFAMPFGPVPSDAKHIIEGKATTLPCDVVYRDLYLKSFDNYSYIALQEPTMKVFSQSDREALDRVLGLFGDMTAMELSALSHKFPEWLKYEHQITAEDSKNSYKINIDLFFEDSDAEDKGLFKDDADILLLSKDLYHQYNRS